MNFDFDKFKIKFFPFLFFMLVLCIGLMYVVKDNLFFYQQETYRSWEIQQSYSEILRQEINSYKDKVSDLNTQLEVCKTELKYVNFIYSEVV